MATSGVITGLMTAGDIITSAMEMINVCAPGETLAAGDMALGVKHLNWLLKAMQGDGVNLWRQTDSTMTWPADTAAIEFSPAALDLTDFRVAGDSERLLTRWESGEYDQLPNKSASGTPTIYSVQKTRDTIKVRVWPVPTEDTDMAGVVSRVIEDVTASTQNVDLPQEWTYALIVNLADRLATVYGFTDMAPRTAADLRANAARLYASMRDMDRPASVFFGAA